MVGNHDSLAATDAERTRLAPRKWASSHFELANNVTARVRAPGMASVTCVVINGHAAIKSEAVVAAEKAIDRALAADAIAAWCTKIPRDTPHAHLVTADTGTEIFEHDQLFLMNRSG